MFTVVVVTIGLTVMSTSSPMPMVVLQAAIVVLLELGMQPQNVFLSNLMVLFFWYSVGFFEW